MSSVVIHTSFCQCYLEWKNVWKINNVKMQHYDINFSNLCSINAGCVLHTIWMLYVEAMTMLNLTVSVCFLVQRHTAQLREELLKLPCPDGLEPDCDEFSERNTSLILKELPIQDPEKPGSSQDKHCSEGQLWVQLLQPPYLMIINDLMASEDKPSLCQYLYVKI